MPQHGRIVFNDNVFGYAPTHDYVGVDRFTLRVHAPDGYNYLVDVSVRIKDGHFDTQSPAT